VAVKQGISRINLLPKDSFEFSPLGRFLSWATTAGRVLVVMTEFVVLLAFGSRFYFDKKLNDLTEVLDQKQAQINAFTETEIKIRTVLAKQTPIDGYLTNNLKFSDKYSSLSRIIPAGVSLEKLTVDGSGMNMIGEAISELGFAQFLNNLKNIPGVSRLSMKETSFDQASGAVKFNIQTTYK
jgi:Tfp pilus assembly protein PilN